jgi:hypothetical protein
VLAAVVVAVGFVPRALLATALSAVFTGAPLGFYFHVGDDGREQPGEQGDERVAPGRGVGDGSREVVEAERIHAPAPRDGQQEAGQRRILPLDKYRDIDWMRHTLCHPSGEDGAAGAGRDQSKFGDSLV